MRATSTRPGPPARGACRILVADDQAVVRMALRGLLAGLGHSVEAVADGPSAVEAAARGFDVIFLDVQMPGLGGFEAARAIREGPAAGRSARIVGLSAEGAAVADLAASGMDDFLVKPVRLADLARVIGRPPVRGRRQAPGPIPVLDLPVT